MGLWEGETRAEQDMCRFSGVGASECKRSGHSGSSRLKPHRQISVLFFLASKAMPLGSSQWKSLRKRLFLQPLTLYPVEDVILTPGAVLEADRLGVD